RSRIDRLGDVAHRSAKVVLDERRNVRRGHEAVDQLGEGLDGGDGTRGEVVLIGDEELGRTVRIEAWVARAAVRERESVGDPGILIDALSDLAREVIRVTYAESE